MDARFDGHVVKMGGIGGVACLPQYRKIGATAAISKKMLEDMYTENVSFSYLFPFSSAYYARHGYACCGTEELWTLDLRALRTVEDDGGHMTLFEGKEEDFNGIKEVYEKYSENFNMSVIRSDVKYKQFHKKAPHKDGYYTYLYRNSKNKPAGVMAFSKKHDDSDFVMDCDCFYFADRTALLSMLSFAKGFLPHYHQVRFSLPGHIDIHDLVPEWYVYDCRRDLRPLGMGRVVNVRSVLGMARYRGGGRITLRVNDPVIPQNEGTYTVDYAYGKAVSVTRDDCATPDATLSINAFSALISGAGESSDTVDFTDFREGMTIHNPPAPFKDIFYQKPLFIMEVF